MKLFTLAGVVAVALGLAACSSTIPSAPSAPVSVISVPATVPSSPTATTAPKPVVKPRPRVPAPAPVHTGCYATNGTVPTETLPDRNCTPGAVNPAVTQATIGQTICHSGWTHTVRPPESYTEPLKIAQVAEYHYADTNVSAYEEDHLIPLELGGSPTSVKNLWPEYDAGHIPNPKDAVENQLRSAVCGGQVTLAAAQQAIARDWTTAESVLGVSP